MAISPRSYGTVAEVAALTNRYTNVGVYDASTNPTETTVENLINSVSATANTVLARAGFVIPVTQEDAKLEIAAKVVEGVVDLCHAANSSGRFFTEKALERGVSPLRVIHFEMQHWAEDMAAGFAALGAARATPDAGQVAYRETDNSGDVVPPLFQREGFSNRSQDWDV